MTWCGLVTVTVIGAGCAAAPSIRTRAMEADSAQGVDGETSAEAPADLPWGQDEADTAISDPLEPINRAFFQFNDRLYFWVLKPVATGYKNVVPEAARIGVRNFFSNLETPVRLGNCLLQGKFEGAGTEVCRFVINTTIGVAGFGDPALSRYDLKRCDEDFGQTLGFYGLGPGFYIHWPVFGPSSLRDTGGALGDGLLDPVSYVPSFPIRAGIRTFETINGTSLRLGDYERLKKSALDPYIALRNAYHQHRQHLIHGEP